MAGTLFGQMVSEAQETCNGGSMVARSGFCEERAWFGHKQWLPAKQDQTKMWGLAEFSLQFYVYKQQKQTFFWE